MTARWAAATVRLEPIDLADQIGRVDEAAPQFLLRALVRIDGGGRQVVGPVVVGRQEARRILMGILDGISDAFWPFLSYEAVDRLPDTEPHGGDV